MTNRKSHKKRSGHLEYSNLEKRELLATASIAEVGGRQVLLIDGGNENDIAVISDFSASEVQLTLNGVDENFDRADFERIRFLGRNGNDQFTNNTNIDSAGFGHAGNDILRGGDGHNWFQGGDGNDQLFGGDRNDLLRGRTGNDTINGGRRHDRLFGDEGNDTIIGESGNDLINGGSGSDELFALNGNDRITGASASDFIQAGEGRDTVQYELAYESYSVFGDESLSVRAQVGGEGTDIVSQAEFFRFSDVTLSAEEAPTATRRVIVRPIVVSNSNGSNSAEFFGNATQEADIKRRIDGLYAQADIDVAFEDARTFNDTFTNIGNGGVRPQSDLSTIVENGDDQGVGSSNDIVLDIYFVEVVPGFAQVGENTGNGLAFIDASGIAVHVGDNLVGSSGGRDLVARVVAHEIGHNLSLPHVEDPNNLLAEDGAGVLLTQAQINQLRDSDFVSVI